MSAMDTTEIFESKELIADAIKWLDQYLDSTWDKEKRDDVPEGQCQPPPQMIIEKVD